MSWAYQPLAGGAASLPSNTPPTVALNSPADASSGSDTTPTLSFTGTDGNSDAIRYNLQIATENTFASPTLDKVSNTDASFAVTTIDENMNADPSTGTKAGDTTWIDEGGGEGHLRLIEATSFARGRFDYVGSLGADFYTTWDYWGGGGSGGEAIWFYWGAIDSPVEEGTDQDQYAVVINAFTDKVELRYAGAVVTDVAYSNIDNSTWRTVEIWNSGNNVKVDINGVEVLDYTDTTRTLGGTDYGWGARNGGANNEWRIRNLILRKAGDPYASGTLAYYTVRDADALAVDTYYWRVRGLDPSGSNTYGAWSSTRSFDITAAGITVTPSTASLTTSTFAPTVTATANQLVTPSVASLTTSLFAPTVFASDSKTATPDTASLTTSTFAPTVSVSNNISVTPSVASLTTSLFAPTVEATNNQIVTPDTASLTTSLFAPTVTATANVEVTPSTASLTTSWFAPTVTATANVVVTPDVASLTTNTFAPTVSTTANQFVTPTTASLVTETFAVTVSATANVEVIPVTASLSLTGFAPTVSTSADIEVTPSTASLTLSAFAPTVDTTANAVVTPSVASLTLATFAPSAVASDNKVVIPSTASLTTSLFAPTVDFTADVEVTPSTASLTLTAFAPTVSASNTVEVVPSTASLTLSGLAPTVAATANVQVVPDVASLTLSPLAPTVVASDHITVTPGTASLALSPQTPKALLGNLYSWQVSGTLPATDAELFNLFTATNFSEILSDDNTYQDITGTGFLILQAKKRNANATDAITINIRSKSTLAPTTATIYMQLYDYNLNTWETVDTDNVTAGNTEMTLTVNKTSTATDYYNEDRYVTVRLYQEVA